MKLVLALVLALASTVANASLLTYNFSGTFGTPQRVAFPGAVSSEPLFLDLIQAGSLFSGSFTFDNAAAPTSHEPAPASYTLYQALAFNLQAGAALAAAVPSWAAGDIQVTDDAGYDPEWLYDELIALTSVQLDANHSLSLALRMNPVDSQAFKDGRVPDGFNRFTDASINLYLFHNNEMVYDYVRGAVQVQLEGASAAIPEPATGFLMLAGLAGLASRRWRA